MVSTQIPSRCTDSETGYATACPDGERTTSALSSRAKSTNSSARISAPAQSPPSAANGSPACSGASIFQTPLPSYPPREVLAITGQPISSPNARSAAASATTR